MDMYCSVFTYKLLLSILIDVKAEAKPLFLLTFVFEPHATIDQTQKCDLTIFFEEIDIPATFRSLYPQCEFWSTSEIALWTIC